MVIVFRLALALISTPASGVDTGAVGAPWLCVSLYASPSLDGSWGASQVFNTRLIAEDRGVFGGGQTISVRKLKKVSNYSITRRKMDTADSHMDRISRLDRIESKLDKLAETMAQLARIDERQDGF